MEELPKHNWDYVKAGIAAGYSRSYAETWLRKRVTGNITFCQRVADKKAEIEATDAQKIDKLVRSWQKIADDGNVAIRDRLKAGELLGKYYAIFTERRILETPDRQRVLSQAEREEARRLALLRFDTRALPGNGGNGEQTQESPASPGNTPDTLPTTQSDGRQDTWQD